MLFLIWQLGINSEIKIGPLEYANSGLLKSLVFGDLISENISEILDKMSENYLRKYDKSDL